MCLNQLMLKGNVLDLVLTSVNVTIDHLTIHPLSVIIFSDHLVISFCSSIDVPSVNAPNPGYVFDFRKADFESILSFLIDLDFSPIFESFVLVIHQVINLQSHGPCLLPRFSLNAARTQNGLILTSAII